MIKRSNDTIVRKWSLNRSTSIVMLGLAIIALMLVAKMIISYSHQSMINKRLELIRAEITKENVYLENESDLLHDTDYYSIYIREEFQLNGNNVIELPGR